MAQLGNQNAARGTRWREAIERAIDQYPFEGENAEIPGRNEKMYGINLAARQFVSKMLQDEDLGFFKEFADRLDGKAVASTEISAPDGKPLFTDISINLVKASDKSDG